MTGPLRGFLRVRKCCGFRVSHDEEVLGGPQPEAARSSLVPPHEHLELVGVPDRSEAPNAEANLRDPFSP